MLNELAEMVNSDKNGEIQEMHTVIGLNRNSAGGPDGMTWAFYQNTWEIIGEDIHNIT